MKQKVESKLKERNVVYMHELQSLVPEMNLCRRQKGTYKNPYGVLYPLCGWNLISISPVLDDSGVQLISVTLLQSEKFSPTSCLNVFVLFTPQTDELLFAPNDGVEHVAPRIRFLLLRKFHLEIQIEHGIQL